MLRLLDKKLGNIKLKTYYKEEWFHEVIWNLIMRGNHYTEFSIYLFFGFLLKNQFFFLK